MGWGDFLKSNKDGQGGLTPEVLYQKSLELDPENPYAHSLLGFHLILSGASLEDAKKHFERALASGRERGYVRYMQLAALLYYQNENLENEAIKIINAMRLAGEKLPPGDRDYSLQWSKLWGIYYFRVLRGNEQQSFLSALSPADHLATFQWLFPGDAIPENKANDYDLLLRAFMRLLNDEKL
jgi:tetratricopeptide (TPR) repeat protein